MKKGALFTGPIRCLQEIREEDLYGKRLNIELLRETGCYVIQNALPKARVNHYLNKYQSLRDTKKDEPSHHPTQVQLKELEEFVEIGTEEKLIQAAAELFDKQAGWDFIRIVRKDEEHRLPVFLHHDVCYQKVSGSGFSFFIALTPNHEMNGGLQIYLGTHVLGYLGDAGELNSSALPDGAPLFKPTLQPGDILVMHSAAWHQSAANIEKSERVYLEMHVVSTISPYMKGVICGVDRRKWVFLGDAIDRDDEEIFLNSRSQRLKKSLTQPTE